MCRHLALQRRQLAEHLGLDLGRQVLVREIDQRLLLRQQQAQPIRPAAIQRAQRTIELTQRLAPLRLRLRGDQVVHRLRLGQVHPAVQECAPGELAGLGWPGAKRDQRIGHAGQHRAAAVQVEFRRILAGVAAGTGQPHHHALIQLGPFAYRAAGGTRHAAAAEPGRTAPPAWRGCPGPLRRITAMAAWPAPGCDREDGVGVHVSLCHADTEGAQRHGRAGKPAPPRDLALSAAARRQPGALAPLGRRRHWRRRERKRNRSCCRSATRPATGATSWRTSRSRTRTPRR